MSCHESKRRKLEKSDVTTLPRPFSTSSSSSSPTSKTKSKNVDDANGFTRQFAHVDGNWPSHVYLTIGKNSKLLRFARSCVEDYSEKRPDVTSLIMKSEASDLHVSLSRPFVLRHHQIEGFLHCLHRSLLACPRLPLQFEIYSEYSILYNDTCTRAFISIPIDDRSKSLMTIVNRGVNIALREMRQPSYYEDAKFHISVASYPSSPDNIDQSSGNQSQQQEVYEVKTEKIEKKGCEQQEDSSGSDLDNSSTSSDEFDDSCASTLLCLETIECKIGNRIFVRDSTKGFVERK